MVRSAPSTSLSMTFSVTSPAGEHPGGPGAGPRAPARRYRRSNCAGDTFTETITSPGLAAVAQASRSTQLPICTIRSLSSARPMNSSADQPAARMVPADQRLRRGDRLFLRQETRLVVQLELAVLQGGAQLGLAQLLLGEMGVHRFQVETPGIAPRGLGLVHRHVGATQQAPRIAAVLRRQGHADAGADMEAVPFVGDLAVDHVDQPATELSISSFDDTWVLTTTNSSPPSRATMSWSRVEARSRSAMA